MLPHHTLEIAGTGVFWPRQRRPLFRLVGVFDPESWGPVGGFPTSDHRAVWVDLELGD